MEGRCIQVADVSRGVERVRGEAGIAFLKKKITLPPVVSGLSKRETSWKPEGEREEVREDQFSWKHITSRQPAQR